MDHMVIVNEPHLRAVLADFARCYNAERPRRTLYLEAPQPVPRSTGGSIHVRSQPGGLHHTYERAA
jgi:putative transposase